MSSEGTEMCRPDCAHCAWQASDEGKAVMAELRAWSKANLDAFLADLNAKAAEANG